MNLIEETHWGIERAKEAAYAVFASSTAENISESLDRCFEAYRGSTNNLLPTDIQDLGDIRLNDGWDTESEKPLIPEEFAPNIGCPVWCDWAVCWALMYLDANYEINLLYPSKSTESFEKLINRMGPYGDKWHLYAHKPEGSAT